MILSGLHELANKMSDPFGDDESDLNIDAFLNTALNDSRRLVFTFQCKINYFLTIFSSLVCVFQRKCCPYLNLKMK